MDQGNGSFKYISTAIFKTSDALGRLPPLRDECLNENWFGDPTEARETIEAWRQDYNQCRPHPALGYRTPEEFAAAAAGDCGKDGGRAALENAPCFPLFHSLDDCGHQPGSAALETQNQEKVSLSLD